MSAPSVLVLPSSFDFFTLDGARCPGIAKIVSGGDAKEKVQDQPQPLTTGANTVVQGSMNAVVTYELTLWLPGHFTVWDQWEAMFLAGRSKRPPRVYKLIDRRYSWVSRVIYENMTPQKDVHPGGPWTRTVEVHQYNRVKPYGGPIKPGVLDPEIAAGTKTNAALNVQIAAMKAESERRRKAGG